MHQTTPKWRNNEEGDKGWEMRAGAQDADVSQAPGKFFLLFYTFFKLH